MSRFTVFGLCLMAVALCFGNAGDSRAQITLEDQLPKSLQERLRSVTGGEPERSSDLTNQVIQSRKIQSQVPREPSAIEELFSERANKDLSQFGYDFFDNNDSVVVRQQGAVQENYILGPGDKLVIDLRGQENATYRVSVDRSGRVLFGDMTPISASGRTFGDFRSSLEKQVKDTFIATQVFVSLEEIRQASVVVSGEVAIPGVHTLSGLSGVLDALVLAGGVNRTGSLRNITVVRGGRVIPVDLYTMLSHRGSAAVSTLQDGDRIVVPPLGKVVAVTGAVQRPGIFELPPGANAIAGAELMDLAGGVQVRGAYRLSLMRIRADGFREFVDLTSLPNAQVADSEILFVAPAVDQDVGKVSLVGHVRVKGSYVLKQVKSLRGLLSSRDIFDRSPYLLFAVISRRNSESLLRELIPFSPIQVLNGNSDIVLADDDIVRIFGVDEIRALGVAVEAAEKYERKQKQNALFQQSNRPRTMEGTAYGYGDPTRGLSQQERSALLPGVAPGQQAGSLAARGNIANGTNPALAAGAAAAAVPGGPRSLSAVDPRYGAATGLGALPAQPGLAEGVPLQSQDGGQALPRDGKARGANGKRGSRAKKIDPMRLPYTLGQELLIDPQVIIRLLANYRVNMFGAVRVPGFYFILPNTSLADLVPAAGGTDFRVDLASVEITATQIDNNAGRSRTLRRVISLREQSMRDTRVQPLDTVRFRQVFSDLDDGTVTLRGQIRFEGTYDILRGERLSSVLKRAGGLTDIAYPYGAVFIRESAARAEQATYRRTATEIESQLMTVQASKQVSTAQLGLVREVLERLRAEEGLGRISIEADPNVLAKHPELDIVLEPGDIIYYPRRPTTVSVTGMVLNTGAYQFRPEHTAEDYVELAGGLARFADRGRMFVVFPDGSSKPLAGSFWRTRDFTIPPGSVIVVPRDLTPFDLGKFAVDFTQILSQIAVSAASIAVITN